MAEKDERIALLMEEGRGMAATEQKHRNVIKKLRSQMAENEKTNAGLKAALQDARTGLAALRSSEDQLEELEKARSEWQTQSSQLRTEVNMLQADLSAKEAIIESLRGDLQKSVDEADKTASRTLADALEAEKRRTREFEDSIASLQVEKNLVAERAQKKETELRDKADQLAERSRVAQFELQGELQATEGRLEAMRALAEEASSGAVGDSQAKLLRQMETLQTQHAIASQNWQGIEASLVARMSNLEKERDDALRRESDMRKKARETLVERMSAAIRRLEGEKMASREELSRISGQRDEARAEMVSLMKETQSGKAASKKVAELEAEVAGINARYQTTLELLGEKSELVEELRADVEDVKAMYRDLVERTVKG
ncbi:hypothetical protein ACHAQH_009932 [Verticillium albo-atrum]